jgi:hypothetical protein
MNGVGLCAIFSRQGDWAFDYALSLARHHRTKLNIFHFLESPYVFRRDVVFVDAAHEVTAQVTPEFLDKRDREVRETFDERLSDYTNVGFRLCKGNEALELRKCFSKGDYEVLVIAYNEKNAVFGVTTTIEEFCSKFRGPVVLVGPDSPNSFYVNAAAIRQLADLMIPDGCWHRIGT